MLRYSYWRPTAALSEAAAVGTPPALGVGDTLEIKCMLGGTGNALLTTDKAFISKGKGTDSTNVETSPWASGAVVGAAPSDAYVAGAVNTYVLTRPPAGTAVGANN